MSFNGEQTENSSSSRPAPSFRMEDILRRDFNQMVPCYRPLPAYPPWAWGQPALSTFVHPYRVPGVYQPQWFHLRPSKRKGGQVRFSSQQSSLLERQFKEHQYLSPEQRRQLAETLSLTERQVKTWFQNRRAKWRRKKDVRGGTHFDNKRTKSKKCWQESGDEDKDFCLEKSEESDQEKETVDFQPVISRSGTFLHQE